MPPVQFKNTPTALQAGDAAIVRRGENVAAVTLGDAATKAVGTAAGQVAAGDHGHAIAAITGLTAALEAKAAADHEHEIEDVPALEARLATQDDAIAEVQAQIQAIVLPEAIVPSGGDIVTALSALSGEARLDASAVKNAPLGEILKTAAEHTSDNTALAAGQRGRESDTQKEKVGPGTWTSLSYVGAAGSYASLTGIPAAIDSIDGLTPAADRIAYYTGATTAALATLTAAGRAVLAGVDAAAQRTALGLGTSAVSAATAYSPAPLFDTVAGFTATNPTVALGQMAVNTDDARVKMALIAPTPWADLGYLGGLGGASESIPVEIATAEKVRQLASYADVVTAGGLGEAYAPQNAGDIAGAVSLDFSGALMLMHTATAAATVGQASGMTPGVRYEWRVVGGASGPHVISFANDCQPQNGVTTVSIATGSIMRCEVMQYVGPDGILRTEFDRINVVAAPADYGPILDSAALQPAAPAPGATMFVSYSARGKPAPVLTVPAWRANGETLSGETDQFYGPIPVGFEGLIEADIVVSGDGDDVARTLEAVVGPRGLPRFVGNRISANNTGTAPVNVTILLPTAANNAVDDVYYAVGGVTSQGDVAGSPATYTPPTGFAWIDTPIPRTAGSPPLGDAMWLGFFAGPVNPAMVTAGNIGTMNLGSNSNCNLLILSETEQVIWDRTINARSASLAANSIAVPRMTATSAAMALAYGHSGSAVTQIQTGTMGAGWNAQVSAQGYGSDAAGRYGSRLFTRYVGPGLTPSGTVTTTGAATATMLSSLLLALGRPRT
jgi:hypothetical protein